MTHKCLRRPGLLLLIFVALLLPAAYASAGGGGIPLTVTFASTQKLAGDASNTYADGEDCSDIGICLRVQLISNSKTLALDTRGTSGPRKLTINFTDFCGKTDAGGKLIVNCGGLVGLDPGDSNSGFPFGSSTTDFDTSTSTLRTEALLEVLLRRPFPSSGSTTGTVKLWFTSDGVHYRVHWDNAQVAVQPDGHWHVIADKTDASEVAGLSELSGKRTKPGDIGNKGFYKIPFLLHACEGVFASCP